MNTTVLAWFGAAVLVATSSELARAQTSCTVSDPTGTPLNVRSRPNGPIVGALHNGATVFVSALIADASGRDGRRLSPYKRARRAGSSENI
jgi:hypothetical protein